jgi:sorting nexin-8
MSTTTNGDDRPGAFSVGSEKGYWRRLESVNVSLMSEREGWFLQKYKIESDVSSRYHCEDGE